MGQTPVHPFSKFGLYRLSVARPSSAVLLSTRAPARSGRRATVASLRDTGRTYQERGGTYLEQINKDQLQRYYVKRLQRLGLTVTVHPTA